MNTKTLLISILFYFALSFAYSQTNEITNLKFHEENRQRNISEFAINKYLNRDNFMLPTILKSGAIQEYTRHAPIYPSVYLSMGLGIGTFNNFACGTYGVNIGLIIEKSIFILRYNRASEIQFLGDNKPNEYISDLGLLYGRTTDIGPFKFSASIGIAYNNGVLRGDLISSSNVMFGTNTFTSLPFESVGIPFQADWFLGIRHLCDINFTLFTNINKKHTFAGLQLALRLGRLNSNYLRFNRE